MSKPRLNGRWYSDFDEKVSVFVEKVFKKGFVTGFKYTKKEEGGEIISPFKATWDELQESYTKAEYHD